MNENMFAHYGIRGMKWGVRRYQNKDGSLTPAGRKRYSDDGQTKTPSKTNTTKTSSSSKKSVSEMSDDELNRAVRRLQLEQQYRNLNPQKVSAGKRFVDKVVKDVIVPAATTTARNTLQTVMKRELDRILKFDTGNNYDRDKKKDK